MSDIHIIDMVTLYCNCGIPFSIPKYYHNMLQQGERTFYCPNGHALKYPPPKKEQPRSGLPEQNNVLKKETEQIEKHEQPDVSISETTIERRVERRATFSNKKAKQFLKTLKNPIA